MKKRFLIGFGRFITPFFIILFRIHVVATGTERARAIITNEHGELLLIRGVIGPSWSLPGGGINRGETAVDAVIREVYEETGMRLDSINVAPLGVLRRTDTNVGYTAHIFTASVTSDMLPGKQFNTHEIIELGWFSPDQLPADQALVLRLSLELLAKR